MAEATGFRPVVVESLRLRCGSERRGAFAQVFGSRRRGRLELFLPLLIPHPHRARGALVSKVDDAVKGLATQFARYLKRLWDRFDTIADCAPERGAENDVAKSRTNGVIDNLRCLGWDARSDDS